MKEEKKFLPALQMKQSEFDKAMFTIVTTAYQDTGNTKISDKDLIYIVSRVQTIISNDKELKNLTLEEIKRAVDNGVFSEDRDYFGINAATIIKMLKHYLDSDERAEYVRSQREYRSSQYQLADKNELSDKDKTEIILAGVDRLFAEYVTNTDNCKSTNLTDLGNAMINTLRRVGLADEHESLEEYFDRKMINGEF